MFEYIKGILVDITPTALVIECGGIGYLIHVANPFAFSASQQTAVIIFVHQVIKEDAHTLYGFSTKEEKEIFLNLISVTGIGPKSALSILANGDINGLVHAIETDNSTYLTKFPGVGKKTAGQLILDLKGKLQTTQTKVSVTAPRTNTLLEEATQGLLGLGYSQKEIQKIMPTLENETFDDTASVLKRAFKLLLKTK